VDKKLILVLVAVQLVGDTNIMVWPYILRFKYMNNLSGLLLVCSCNICFFTHLIRFNESNYFRDKGPMNKLNIILKL
jgi:hypothetical protein